LHTGWWLQGAFALWSVREAAGGPSSGSDTRARSSSAQPSGRHLSGGRPGGL